MMETGTVFHMIQTLEGMKDLTTLYSVGFDDLEFIISEFARLAKDVVRNTDLATVMK